MAEPGTGCKLEFKTGALMELQGGLATLKSRPDAEGGGRLLLGGDGELSLTLAEDMTVEGQGEDSPVEEDRGNREGRACRTWRLRLTAGRSQAYIIRPRSEGAVAGDPPASTHEPEQR